MWLAALAGRLSYLVHTACGHAVTWKTSPPDLPLCPGDIVCDDCGQVLWCRAHDPWRAVGPAVPADHWGATRLRPTPLEDFEHVLRVAVECPAGRSGDDIRRAACELIEASSVHQRHLTRRRMLKAIARANWRHSRGRSRGDDPSPLTLSRLTDALRGELWPGC